MPQTGCRVIWSVDAFEETPKLAENVSKILAPVSQKLDCAIEPVYVLSPDRINLPTEFASHDVGHLVTKAEETLNRLSTETPGPVKWRPPHVVVQNGYSVSRSVKALVDYA